MEELAEFDLNRPLNPETGAPLDIMEGGTYPYKDPVFKDKSPLFTPIKETEAQEENVPPEFASVMSNLFNEASLSDDSKLTVKNRDMLDAYNRVFDDRTKEMQGEDILNIATGMAERGVPARTVSEWYNKELVRINQLPQNSGVFRQLANSRLVRMAEQNPTLAALLTDPTADNVALAGLTLKYQDAMANIDIFNTKVAEANAAFDSQHVLTQMGKGLATGAAIPFINNLNTRFVISPLMKEMFGEEFGPEWNQNALYEKLRQKLYEAERNMPPEEFKNFIDTMDKKILEGFGLTYGDRKDFWNNLYSQQYRLNKGVFAGDALALGLSGKFVINAAQSAARSGATKAAVAKVAAVSALNEAIPGSGITMLGVGKMANMPFNILKNMGQRKKAAALIADLDLKADFLSTEIYKTEANRVGASLMEDVGSGLSKPKIGDAAIDISKTEPFATTNAALESKQVIDVGLDRAKELTEKILKYDNIGDLLRETRTEAEKKFILDVVHNKKKAEKFFQSVSSTSTSKDFTTTFEFGRNFTNEGFATQADAEKFASKLNVVSDDFFGYNVITSNPKIQKRADGYYVTLERSYADIQGNPVTLETITSSKMKLDFPENARKTFSSNPVANMLSTNLTIPHLERTINQQYQLAEGTAMTFLQNNLLKVKKGNGPLLEQLMNITHSQDAWMRSDRLLAKGVPQKVVDAYEAMRTIQDVSFFLHGKNVYNGLVESGMKNISAGGKRIGLGKLAEDRSGKTLYLLDYDEAAEKIVPRKVLDKEVIDDSYNVYKMLYSIDGEAKYVAIKKNVAFESDPTWTDTFLSYHAGRMSFPQGSGFIKQLRIGRGEKGESWVDGIATIFSHPNQKSVRETTELLEKARQLAIKVKNKEIDLAQAERLFSKFPNREHLQFASFESFYNQCGKGKLISLDPEAKLKYVADGQRLPDVVDGFNIKDYNTSGIEMIDYSMSERIVAKTKRTNANVLDPFTLEEAPRVSISEELGMQVEKIIKSNSAASYTKVYADDFKNTFGEFFPKDMSPKEMLLYADLENFIKDRDTLNMAKHARETYMLVRGTPSAGDLRAVGAFQWFAERAIPGWKAPEGSNMLALYKNFAKFNPMTKLRAFSFHYLLGMYNPRQLYVQALASANAYLLSPKAATQITPLMPAIMGYVMSGDKSFLYRASKKLGISPGYLEDLCEGVKALDIWSKGSFGGAFNIAERGKVWDRLSSTFFYDYGEFTNRVYSAAVTQQEYLNKGIKHGVLGLSKSELMQAGVRHQNLYVNMGRAGTSQIQRGLGGVLTQFQGFPMRAVETLFDTTIDKKNRLIFAAGQLGLGGFKGALGRPTAMWIHSGLEALGFNDAINDTIYNGVLDQLVLENGGHISLGEFFSPQAFDIFEFGIDNIPSIQTMSRLSKGVGQALEVATSYCKGGPLAPDSFASTLNVLSDMARRKVLLPVANNALLGWWAYTTGTRLGPDGRPLDTNLSKTNAFLIGLGFKDPKRDMEALMAFKMKSRKEQIEDLSKTIEALSNEGLYAPTQEMRDSAYQATHNFLSEIYARDPELATEARKKAYSRYKTRNIGVEKYIQQLESMSRVTGFPGAIDRVREELNKANDRAKE